MHGIIVLKCGGSSVDELSDHFFEAVLSMKEVGFQPVIVHGGGPSIKEMLMTKQVETEFIDGLRKTTKPVMEIVEMVLTGQVSNYLTRKLTKKGISSIGLSGSDNQLLIAEAIDYDRYGYVGKVKTVNVSFLKQLFELDVVPVIAPVALGENGDLYNINADSAAGAVAKALAAKQLIFVTDVPGIMQRNELLESVTDIDIENLIAEGVIMGGMIPKVRAAVDSLNDDLLEVMIVDANQTAFSNETKLVGTIIKKSVGVV